MKMKASEQERGLRMFSKFWWSRWAFSTLFCSSPIETLPYSKVLFRTLEWYLSRNMYLKCHVNIDDNIETFPSRKWTLRFQKGTSCRNVLRMTNQENEASRINWNSCLLVWHVLLPSFEHHFGRRNHLSLPFQKGILWSQLKKREMKTKCCNVNKIKV